MNDILFLFRPHLNFSVKARLIFFFISWRCHGSHFHTWIFASLRWVATGLLTEMNVSSCWAWWVPFDFLSKGCACCIYRRPRSERLGLSAGLFSRAAIPEQFGKPPTHVYNRWWCAYTCVRSSIMTLWVGSCPNSFYCLTCCGTCRSPFSSGSCDWKTQTNVLCMLS